MDLNTDTPRVAGRGGLMVSLAIETFRPDGTRLMRFSRPFDMTLKQCAQLFQLNVAFINTTVSVTDTGGVARVIPATLPTAVQVAFGIGTTPAAFTDHVIQTPAGGTNPVTATVNALSSNTFTVTGNWTNTTGGSVSISEVACYVTVGGFVFAITHDVFAGQAVANGVICAATLTFTWT